MHTSIYLFACPLPTGCMDGRMDGYCKWMDPCKHNHRYIDTMQCRISSSSFRWRLCCWERHWLKSSASCGHLSLVVDCSGANVQTNHNLSRHVTSIRICQNLSESARIYHQPHHQQYDQTKITQYKLDNANNY